VPPIRNSLWLERTPETRRFPTLGREQTADVVVVGGGITGITAAYLCVRAGQRVVLLEAAHLGTGETGYTTAFLTSSVDTPFFVLRQTYGDEQFRLLRSAGEDAIALVERIVKKEALSCDFRRVDAFAFGLRETDRSALEREQAALEAAGATSSLLGSEELRRSTDVQAIGAIRIPGQATFDPRAYVLQLAEHIVEQGGGIFEESRCTGIETGQTVSVRTPSGRIQAGHALLATGLFPPPYRAQNTLLHQVITYVIAARAVRGPLLPDALYWDALQPFHYLRRVGDLCLIGGEDRDMKTATKAGEAPWHSLAAFAHTVSPAVAWDITHTWQGQILETADSFPLVGAPAGADPRILLLSGFGGNGMTLGAWSAKIATDIVTGRCAPENNPFRFDRQTLKPVANNNQPPR
jgi:glycine/D-amino acid oxidase-like deaminating enzyme